MMTRFSRGQMKMSLASMLHRAGMGPDYALDAAMQIIDAGSVPAVWRNVLGAEVSDAINVDLIDAYLAEAATTEAA